MKFAMILTGYGLCSLGLFLMGETMAAAVFVSAHLLILIRERRQ